MIWLAVVVFLLAAAAGGAGAHLASGPRPAVLLVGDSIAVGVGSHLRRIRAERDEVTVVRAEVGTTMLHWRTRSAGFPSLAGQTVVIILGGNDSAANEDYQATTPGLARQIVHNVRQKGASAVVWCVIPRYSAKVQEAIKESGADWATVPGFELAADGLHYTVAGYEQFARWVDGFL